MVVLVDDGGLVVTDCLRVESNSGVETGAVARLGEEVSVD